jgi:hypothetical protein
MVFFVLFACLLVMLVGVVLADQLSQEARLREKALREVDELIARELKAEQELTQLELELEQKDKYLY